ncbi:hypothetical protein [Kitasatospora kifunensis]|uniref:Uncharacterized protein n=1 Tax=Kitasatospora kifunensis TaxID=58351 RepID=A0A7W7QY51_KITKI|nr:hypothetical protein [Kitasatospora kifunensis]MBB4921981.1 hypothetical protein [Kitasatospora kifunensis]
MKRPRVWQCLAALLTVSAPAASPAAASVLITDQPPAPRHSAATTPIKPVIACTALTGRDFPSMRATVTSAEVVTENLGGKAVQVCDALAPVIPANGSLNGDYRYVGSYY